MLKLAILNKPKELLLKCKTKFPDVILANLQEKEITPTKSVQEITPDSAYDGLSKVTIDKIPDEYIIPKISTKTVTKNGTYKASDENLDGYSEVEVATSGVDINDYFNTDFSNSSNVKLASAIKNIPKIITSSKTTSIASTFSDCINLENVDLSGFVTNNVTDMQSVFDNCTKLKTIDFANFNGAKVRYISRMFYGCKSLITIIPRNFFNSLMPTIAMAMFYNCSKLETLNLGGMNASKLTNINVIFGDCSSLKNLTFFSNYGQGFTATNNNYSSYTLDLSSTALTHDSLMDVINKLYDLNLTYNVSQGGTLYTQSLILGSKLLAKLTADEIAVATNKGWTVK